MNISIIIPNYNHGKYINEIIKIIKISKIKNYEIIIIDDCSTDNSVKLINEIINNNKEIIIKFYKNNSNLGAVATMNLGVEIASGEFFYIASADDVFNDKLLKKSLEVLEKNKNAAFSISKSKISVPNNGLIDYPYFEISKNNCYISPTEFINITKFNGSFLGGNTIIWRKIFFIKYGSFDVKLKGYCDIYLLINLAVKEGFCFLSENLATFILQDGSYSQKLFTIENINDSNSLIMQMRKKTYANINEIKIQNCIIEYVEDLYLELNVKYYKNLIIENINSKELFIKKLYKIIICIKNTLRWYCSSNLKFINIMRFSRKQYYIKKSIIINSIKKVKLS